MAGRATTQLARTMKMTETIRNQAVFFTFSSILRFRNESRLYGTYR